MRWPRGRYNPGRIVGFEVKFQLDIRSWRFGVGSRWSKAVFIGPFHFWFSPAYDWSKPSGGPQ